MQEVTTNFSKNYEIKEQLGKGGYALVNRCVHKATKNEYAVKIIDMRKMPATDFYRLELEARICRKLKHKNIVQLHDYSQENGSYYLVLDLVTGGELFDDIVAREFYSEADASKCIQQVLESIAYCHQNNVLHRDLKAENLLLSRHGKGANVKLADFGLAVELRDDSDCWHGFAGTPGYMSPELLNDKPYGKPVDIWACGVILYLLLAGYPPFWDDKQHKLFTQIRNGTYEYPSPEWDSVSPQAKALIDAMLTLDPKERITAQAALKSPFISNRSHVALSEHRGHAVACMRKFNAKRKLKGAILTTILANKTGEMLANSRKSSAETALQSQSATAISTVKEEEIVPSLKSIINGMKTNGMANGVKEKAEPENDEFKTNGGMKKTENNGIITNGFVINNTNGLGQHIAAEVEAAQKEEIITVTQQLLDAISHHDYSAFLKLYDPKGTCIQLETLGNLIEGVDFHKFNFAKAESNDKRHEIRTTLLNPTVHLMGDVAIIAYTLLTQSDAARITQAQETRMPSSMDFVGDADEERRSAVDEMLWDKYRYIFGNKEMLDQMEEQRIQQLRRELVEKYTAENG